jgi:formylglycine-generating enzyme required for sulfatase activity
VTRVRRFLAALLFLPACDVDADVARFPAIVDSGVLDTSPKCPAGMIDLGAFCIDATEVTKRQYQVFLDAKVGVSSDPNCAWNSNYAPRAGDSCDGEEDLTKDPDHPVVCVDWCDAATYCAWAGKRICGAIAGGPEPYKDPTVMNDASKSQWFAACAGGSSAARKYPYGDSYQPVCNDLASGGAVKNVGSMPACHGPAGTPQAAVFDMSGNVYEWVDNCQVSAAAASQQSCLTRGGYYANNDVTEAGVFDFLTCAVGAIENTKSREAFDDHIGIRCCSR